MVFSVLWLEKEQRIMNHPPELIEELKEFFLIRDDRFIKGGAVDYPILWSPDMDYLKESIFVVEL